MRKFIFILIWLVSVIVASIYTYENPEVIESIRHNFEKHLPSKVKFEQGPYNISIGNSFAVEFSQEISFSEKTAFIVHDENVLNFNKNSLKVYFQNGYLLKNSKLEMINLPNTFTTAKNGGV